MDEKWSDHKEALGHNEWVFTVRKHVFYDLLDGVINFVENTSGNKLRDNKINNSGKRYYGPIT